MASRDDKTGLRTTRPGRMSKAERPRRERTAIATSEIVGPTRPHPLIGATIAERYLVEGEIGAGAMGHVFRGRHLKLPRAVAIKVLHDHYANDPLMLARFRREAQVAGRLHHPNVVGVLDVGELPDGRHVMVMELAEGRPLTELLAHAPLPRDRIISLTRSLLAGLDHAHEQGLIHRDLKPDNVLVKTDAHGLEIPQIVDFGIAILRTPDGAPSGRLTAPGMVVGTPQYMAPEQAKDEPIDHRVDLFAMGVILYEMLAGQPPFDGARPIDICLANINRDPPPVTVRTPTAPPPDPLLDRFMRRLMARHRDHRFSTAHAALALLDLIATDPQSAATELMGK